MAARSVSLVAGEASPVAFLLSTQGALERPAPLAQKQVDHPVVVAPQPLPVSNGIGSQGLTGACPAFDGSCDVTCPRAQDAVLGPGFREAQFAHHLILGTIDHFRRPLSPGAYSSSISRFFSAAAFQSTLSSPPYGGVNIKPLPAFWAHGDTLYTRLMYPHAIK